MFHRIGSDKIQCGLDIGDQSLKAALIKSGSQSEPWDILGIFEHPTWGYKNGVVTDLAEFSECIAQTVNQLSQKVGAKVRDVAVGIGPSFVQVRPVQTMIPLVDKGSKMIVAKDIIKVNQQARLLGVEMDEEVIHDLPLSYQIDAAHGVRDPFGLNGRKLGVSSLMVLSSANRIRDIRKAINQAGFETRDMFFGNYLTRMVSLTEEERMKGCLLVDLGASSTTVMAFKDGVLSFYERVSLGGADITKSLAEALHVPFDLAEEIKQAYADLSATDGTQNEEILVKKEGVYLPVRRSMIDESVSKSVVQIVSKIHEIVSKDGRRHYMNAGVVLVGGGAELNGMIEYFEQEVGLSTRIGRLEVANAPSIQRAARFLTVLAVAKFSVDGEIISGGKTDESSWVRRMTRQLSNLYQEYF
jgi:cell division protein FtsA